MSSAFWLATRRTDRTSRIYPVVKVVLAPSDEAPDALEDAPSLGYVPIDEISLEMLAAEFYEDEDDRKDRMYGEPQEGEPGFGADPLDLLMAQQEAQLACNGLWDNEIEEPRPGDEAIPMSQCSALREAFRPTVNQDRVIRLRSHGVHGHKPTKPARTTIRKMEV